MGYISLEEEEEEKVRGVSIFIDEYRERREIFISEVKSKKVDNLKLIWWRKGIERSANYI